MASQILTLFSCIKTSPLTRTLSNVQPAGVRFTHTLTRTFLQVGGKPGANPARGHITAAPRASLQTTPVRRGSQNREAGSFSPPGKRGWLGRAAVGAALGVGTLVVGSSLHTGSLAAMALKVDLTSAAGDWKETKEFLLSLPAMERREYFSTNSVLLDDIPVWTPTAGVPGKSIYPRNDKLDQKISLYSGDITMLQTDAIVNAANQSLLGGGGVDGAIHRAAGPLLKKECASLHGCETGQAKITGGYALPAKYVIHTVGPIAQGGVGEEQQNALRSCYKKSLQMATANAARSVAFPCISTGVYGYPPEQAVHEALATVREYLDQHHDKLDRVIFCVFLPKDKELYLQNLPLYFPAGLVAAGAGPGDGPELCVSELQADRQHAAINLTCLQHLAAPSAAACVMCLECVFSGVGLNPTNPR